MAKTWKDVYYTREEILTNMRQEALDVTGSILEDWAELPDEIKVAGIRGVYELLNSVAKSLEVSHIDP